MTVEFSNATSQNYAIDPQIVKNDGKRVLRLTEQGCSHFLILRFPLGRPGDLRDPELQKRLAQLGPKLMENGEKPLPGGEGAAICMDRMNFYKNHSCVELSDQAASYAICGCHYSETEGVFRLLIPTEGMNYVVSVSVEIPYSAAPHSKWVKKGLFKKELQQTPFYQVNLEKKAPLQEGSLSYKVANLPFRIPVPEQMLGKTVLIRADDTIPEFFSDIPGIVLKKKQ